MVVIYDTYACPSLNDPTVHSQMIIHAAGKPQVQGYRTITAGKSLKSNVRFDRLIKMPKVA